MELSHDDILTNRGNHLNILTVHNRWITCRGAGHYRCGGWLLLALACRAVAGSEVVLNHVLLWLHRNLLHLHFLSQSTILIERHKICLSTLLLLGLWQRVTASGCSLDRSGVHVLLCHHQLDLVLDGLCLLGVQLWLLQHRFTGHGSGFALDLWHWL